MDIKILVLDVDGILTDGKIYLSVNGELMKAFNIKDGYALARLPQYGITPIIVTGRQSEIVEQRCKELKIKEIHQGIENKALKLRELCKKYQVDLKQCAYIGDDLNDVDCMRLCGHTAAPADAVSGVCAQVNYVCKQRGGDGAVREYCDYLVKNFDNREEEIKDYEFNEMNFDLDE